jgi:hypothetical protein
MRLARTGLARATVGAGGEVLDLWIGPDLCHRVDPER